jgi:hypothetical protein
LSWKEVLEIDPKYMASSVWIMGREGRVVKAFFLWSPSSSWVLLQPQFPVQAAVVDRFGDVFRFDVL